MSLESHNTMPPYLSQTNLLQHSPETLLARSVLETAFVSVAMWIFVDELTKLLLPLPLTSAEEEHESFSVPEMASLPFLSSSLQQIAGYSSFTRADLFVLCAFCDEPAWLRRTVL